MNQEITMKNLRNLAIVAAIFVTGSVCAQTVALTNAGSLDSDIVDKMAAELQATFKQGGLANCAGIKLDRMSPVTEVENSLQLRTVWCYAPTHAAQAAWIWGYHQKKLKSGVYAGPLPFVRYVSRSALIDVRDLQKLDEKTRELVLAEMRAAGNAAEKARSTGLFDRTDDLIFTAMRVVAKVH